MRVRRIAQLAAMIVGFTASLVVAGAQAPDNTERNKGNRTATADQQSNSKADVDVTKRIRQAIVADKDLSTNAHNVKIITRAGKVTLKGPVRTEAEKQTVEAKAAEIAGAGNVVNQVSVTDPTSAKKSDAKTGKRAPAPKER